MRPSPTYTAIYHALAYFHLRIVCDGQFGDELANDPDNYAYTFGLRLLTFLLTL